MKTKLIKQTPIEWPVIETEIKTSIIVSHKRVDQAFNEATKQMVKAISNDLNTSWEEG
ncbi:Acetamidase/formamidase, nonfunctional [Methanonatronarchaeum thermophilum]|uniref:Acetamidase/formamidase, nonfunctional n=1 Tax=Methanonatronarchaeum thermophilum TaxID=1927129 RepID=A0A1Y3GC40_9EURY|nr:hypothetical protein [Methanonatronarchaeum thermophilum]OUJ18979.1 Acetamidase/formamidase, nonfunctional [Methanonatronarchaeum thermophilum]